MWLWCRSKGAPLSSPFFSTRPLSSVHLHVQSHTGRPTSAATVEALRRTAELLVWGGRHDARLVDYFLEAGLLGCIVRAVLGVPAVPPPGGQEGAAPPLLSGPVTVQALQTLAILVAHLGGAPPACYALFSGGHLDAALAAGYDLADDEVLGHYVALLKSIGARLDETTVHFFYHDGVGPDGTRTGPPRFPLYAAASSLIDHPEPLARAAARALALGIHAIPDPAVQAFIAADGRGDGRGSGAGWFDAAARHAAGTAGDLRDALAAEEAALSASAASRAPPSAVPAALAHAAAGLEDELGYCADVLATRPAALAPPPRPGSRADRAARAAAAAVAAAGGGKGGAAAAAAAAAAVPPPPPSPPPPPLSSSPMLAATPGATAAAAARERRRASLGEDWSSESPPAGAAAFGAATDASPASPPTSSASLPPAAALLADRLWDRLVIPRILEPLAALAAGLDGECGV